jgi:hypothetical protein
MSSSSLITVWQNYDAILRHILLSTIYGTIINVHVERKDNGVIIEKTNER